MASVEIYLPVKRTSDPESLASEDSRSTTVRPSSFLSTALTERQSCTLAMLSPPPFSFGLSLVFDFGSSWSSSTPGRHIKAIPLCVTAQSRAAHGEWLSKEIWIMTRKTSRRERSHCRQTEGLVHQVASQVHLCSGLSGTGKSFKIYKNPHVIVENRTWIRFVLWSLPLPVPPAALWLVPGQCRCRQWMEGTETFRSVTLHQ